MTQAELFEPPKPQTLRPYQTKMVEGSINFIEKMDGSTESENTLLWSAPTGSGKGTTILALLKACRAMDYDAIILTPSIEIIRGFLDRLGVSSTGGNPTIAKRALKLGISTAETFANRLMDGRVEAPDVVLWDEAQTALLDNKTPKLLFSVLAGSVKIGFTATPYRATPKSTKHLRDLWGEPQVALSISDAVRGGYMSLPRFSIVPICNDDEVRVGAGGELIRNAVTAKYKSKIENAIELVGSYYDPETKLFDKGTMVSCPSQTIVDLMVTGLNQKGVPAVGVTTKTDAKTREESFRRVQLGEIVILQIGVLTTGVDLPGMRRLIDMQPTMSPVRWMQTIGRVCRPGIVPSEVVVTNRNLARHYYLLEGLLPRAAVVEEQVAFGGVTRRAGARELDFEALGKLKRIPIPLSNGGEAAMFNICQSDSMGHIDQYAVILAPGAMKPLVARQVKTYDPNDPSPLREVTYSGWVETTLPSDFNGFSTDSNTKPLSDKQRRWWEKAAGRYGLDSNKAGKIKRRQFAAFMVLKKLGRRID